MTNIVGVAYIVGMMKPLDIIIHKAGGITSLARQLGITHNAIYSWKKIPPIRVLDIERITGISRHDLRPDLYPRPSKQDKAA